MVAVPSPTVTLFITCILMSWLQAKVSNQTNKVPKSPYSLSLLRDNTICRITPGLTKTQLELCYQQPDTTEVALEGIQQAVEECQHQFQHNRWNCSSLATKSRIPYTSAIFHKGYRETAFAYAISSAGVTIAVARACSYGRLLNCACDPHSYKIRGKRSSSSQFKWGGCSHNLKYGMRFSKMFLDSREKATDLHSKINLHNNQVGRLAVANNMQLKCKCHGMSGSCELKTCWRSTLDFRQVGKILKENFRTAVLVDQSNSGNRPRKNSSRARVTKKRKKNRSRIKEWTPHKTKHRKRDLMFDLLYYQKSPNFCERVPTIDVPGTAGRECNRTTTGPNSCSSLCCGRGYSLQRRRRIERCNCRFIWCCTVECQTCNIEEWISVCN